MNYIDCDIIVELTLLVAEGGETTERQYPVTARKHSWNRRVYEIVAALARDGATPGSGAVPASSTAPARRILSATARLKNGSRVDILDQFIEDGWRTWLDTDRYVRLHQVPHSTPERDARIRAHEIVEDAQASDWTPEHDALDAAYDMACVAEKAAVLRTAASWQESVAEEPVPEEAPATEGPAVDPVIVEPVAVIAEPVTPVQEPEFAPPIPTPANDTSSYDTALRRARSARNAAEAEERQTLAAFLAAQEARRQAQADLDEIQATAELYSAPAVADVGEDRDPRLGPDADEEAAESEAHAEFVATLNGLEADDRLTDALAATDAAESELWSAVSRAELALGAEVATEIGAACRLLWRAHQAERVASDIHDRACDGRSRLAA